MGNAVPTGHKKTFLAEEFQKWIDSGCEQAGPSSFQTPGIHLFLTTPEEFLTVSRLSGTRLSDSQLREVPVEVVKHLSDRNTAEQNMLHEHRAALGRRRIGLSGRAGPEERLKGA